MWWNADAVQCRVVVHPQVGGKQERFQGEWSRVDATPGSSLHTLMSTNTHSKSQPATTISIVCLFLPCDGVGAPSQPDQSVSYVENASTPENLQLDQYPKPLSTFQLRLSTVYPPLALVATLPELMFSVIHTSRAPPVRPADPLHCAPWS